MDRLQQFLREKTTRGTPLFPVGFYRISYPEQAEEMLIHWHEELEFAFVSDGCITYEVNQTAYRVEKGSLILLMPNVLHAAHCGQSRNAVTESVVLPLSMVQSDPKDGCTSRYITPILEGRITVPPVLTPDNPCYRAFFDCFQQLWQCREQDLPYRELQFKTQLLCLIREIWEISVRRDEKASECDFRMYEKKLQPALEHIENHYGEPISVEILADCCGFSQVHFMNTFKSALGISCIEYLIAYRLNASAIQLRTTCCPVAQIAMDCGFPTISHFNRCFRRKYQMTPSAYRHKYAKP